MNLSKFVNDALYEHSGKTNKKTKEEVEQEIKDLETKIAIKKAVINEIKVMEQEEQQAINAEEMAKQKEIAFLVTHCKGCRQEFNKDKLKRWGGMCYECYKKNFRAGNNDNGLADQDKQD